MLISALAATDGAVAAKIVRTAELAGPLGRNKSTSTSA
jgi:hypothetical protein